MTTQDTTKMEGFDLAELKRLMEAATKGPWRVCNVDETMVLAEGRMEVASMLGDYDSDEGYGMAADAAFIVAACNAIPGLIAEVEQLRDRQQRAPQPTERLQGLSAAGAEGAKP